MAFPKPMPGYQSQHGISTGAPAAPVEPYSPPQLHSPPILNRRPRTSSAIPHHYQHLAQPPPPPPPPIQHHNSAPTTTTLPPIVGSLNQTNNPPNPPLAPPPIERATTIGESGALSSLANNRAADLYHHSIPRDVTGVSRSNSDSSSRPSSYTLHSESASSHTMNSQSSSYSLNSQTSQTTTPTSRRSSHAGLFNPAMLKLQHPPASSVSSFSDAYSKNPEQFHDVLESPFETSFPLEPELEEEEENSGGKATVAEMSALGMDMDGLLRRFQANELKQTGWPAMVPEEARATIEHDEVLRQCSIFEMIQGERDYVNDLETIEAVFVRGLLEAKPPPIPLPEAQAFVNEVFGNYKEIMKYHKAMLEQLYQRQMEQHPLVQSIADIMLETLLRSDFREAYQTNIKHYAVAAGIHAKQKKTNPAYVAFLQSVSSDPRLDKRDLMVFCGRAFLRLPRIKLILKDMLKRTDKEHNHPDLEVIPMMMDILDKEIKSSQIGIETAENRVKFMDFCEHLVPLKGEILDMDLFDNERHLAYSSPVYVKTKGDGLGSGEKWMKLEAVLLDNYFILCREHKAGPVTKYIMYQRPVPLSFIGLVVASFTSPPENRKEKSEEGGLLDTFRSVDIPMYPFTFSHNSPTALRAYKIYLDNAAMRTKWHKAFRDALGIHKVKQQTNPWYSQELLTENYFRRPKEGAVPSNTKGLGAILTAVPFNTPQGRFLAVACTNGIYVARYGSEDYRRVFNHPNVQSIAAIQTNQINKFIIHHETDVVSYSLDLIALCCLGQERPQTLEGSKERVVPKDQHVLFLRHMITAQERVVVIYASKKRLSAGCYIHSLEAVPPSVASKAKASFRPHGPTATIPREAHDISPLRKTIAICTRDGLVTADPENLTTTTSSIIPILASTSNNNGLAMLKNAIEGARPLGFLRVSPQEILIIYDTIGCFIDSRGAPTRKGGYVRWETKVTAWASRHNHVFLVSPRFVEIRNVATGRLLQVIEGVDVRLLFSGPALSPQDKVLIAMRGRQSNDTLASSEKIVELAETEPYAGSAAGSTAPTLWSEWDM